MLVLLLCSSRSRSCAEDLGPQLLVWRVLQRAGGCAAASAASLRLRAAGSLLTQLFMNLQQQLQCVMHGCDFNGTVACDAHAPA